MTTKRNFIVLIERDEDGIFIGTVPAIEECHSFGKTLDELMTNMKETIGAYFEAFTEEEKALPIIRFVGIQEIGVEV